MEKGTPMMKFVLKGSFRPFLSACNPTVWFWLFFGHLIKLGLGTGINLVPRLAQIGKTWTGLINFPHSPEVGQRQKKFSLTFHCEQSLRMVTRARKSSEAGESKKQEAEVNSPVSLSANSLSPVLPSLDSTD